MGALFALGTSAYSIVSSPASVFLGTSTVQVLAVLATLNSVFFWWFATSLFDDEVKWRWWRAGPFVLMLLIYFLRVFDTSLVESWGDDLLQQVLIISMMLHALWLALANRSGDLIEIRRQFRLFFALIVGCAGIIITIFEMAYSGDVAPPKLTQFHAFSLLVLTLAFSNWILQPVDVFQEKIPHKVPVREITSLDQAAQVRLEKIMRDGLYRKEGLTIGALANAVSYPEYKLRKIINSNMGYRNIGAFLNFYRIAEAKIILADPKQERVQVTQIAYDIGYGSLATFNRAFKAAVGVSPSAYRNKAIIDHYNG